MSTKSNIAVAIALSATAAWSQVGIGTSSPHVSAALEISSTDKGLLIPRMTTAERGSIPNPLPGMMIYNSTDLKFQGYVGVPGTWIETVPENLANGALARWPNEEIAQTILAPSTEEIIRVSARCWSVVPGTTNPGSVNTIAKIYSGVYNSGSPGSPVATSSTATITSLGTYTFEFSPTFQPTVNTTYTIVFKNLSSTDRLFFFEYDGNYYTNGHRFTPPITSSNSDDLILTFYSLSGSWVNL